MKTFRPLAQCGARLGSAVEKKTQLINMAFVYMFIHTQAPRMWCKLYSYLFEHKPDLEYSNISHQCWQPKSFFNLPSVVWLTVTVSVSGTLNNTHYQVFVLVIKNLSPKREWVGVAIGSAFECIFPSFSIVWSQYIFRHFHSLSNSDVWWNDIFCWLYLAPI